MRLGVRDDQKFDCHPFVGRLLLGSLPLDPLLADWSPLRRLPLGPLLLDGLPLVGLLLARLLSDGLLLVALLLARLLSDGLLLIGLLLAGLPFGRSRRLCRCEERQQTKRDPAPHRSIIPDHGGMRRQTDFVE